MIHQKLRNAGGEPVLQTESSAFKQSIDIKTDLSIMKRLTFTLAFFNDRMRLRSWKAIAMALVGLLYFQQAGVAQTSCPLACNDQVQVSLDDNCSALITPDVVLEAPGAGCMYSVRVHDRNGQIIPNSTVGYSHIGQTLQVSVFLGNNSCWGTIKVEDKLAPQLDCGDEQFTTCADTSFVPTLPILVDNCDPNPEILVLSDVINDLDCDFQGYSARRIITYRGVDHRGNYSGTCQQVIWYERRSLSDVTFPPNWDGIDTVHLTCDNIDPEWDLNGDYYPNPVETGVPMIDGYPIYPENKGFCEMNVTFSDQVIPICDKSFKVLRKWTIVDWCSPVGTSTFPPNPYEVTQIIKVVDDAPPIVVCPPAYTVSTDIWTCTASTFAPPPTVLYDCNDWDYEVFYKLADQFGNPSITGAIPAVRYPNGLYYIPDLPLGRTWLIYRITDACGNSTECASEVDVEDEVPPTPVCDEHTVVSLGANGTAKAFAQTFDDGSVDNCEIVHFDVRRMDEGEPCGQYEPNFRDFVEFCCEDIGNTVTVILRVWDRAENTNTCMVEVNVQDKLPPFIECPPNITVSCEYDFEDFDDFGTVRNSKDAREPIVIDDPRADFAGPAIDGYAVDNCDFEITVSVNENITCGRGTVRRTFTAEDPQGLTNSCTQIITFVDFDPNNVTITPPLNYEKSVSCMDPKNTSPDSTGRPIIDGDDKCSLIAINYTDQEFVLEPDACLKILRTWTIIDWCNYEQGNPTAPFPRGKWTYTQVIKLSNDVAPVFVDRTCNNRTFDIEGPGCAGFIELIGLAEDDCTPEGDLRWSWSLDLFDDGIIDTTGNTNDASMIYPVGRHVIRWEVEDQCGNVNYCESVLRVRDAKKPTPYCLHGISTVVMPSTETLDIWASDFNLNSEDNCTAKEDLKFYFEVNGVFETSITLDCSHIGENEIRMYVVDEAGNSDYCTTYLVLTDPNGVCGGGNPIISGQITTNSGNAAVDVDVFLDRNSPPSQKILQTNQQGRFSFNNLSLQNGYAVYARNNSNPMNGVSTKDLVAIQRHLLGQMPINDSYKLIAADANNDERVSVKDLVEIRKLILGINNQFQNGQRSWRFVAKDYRFSNPQNPFPFVEQIVYDRLQKDEMSTNFIAVKIGDVTGDAQSNYGPVTQSRSYEKSFVMALDNEQVNAGEMVSVPVYATDVTSLVGFQLALQLKSGSWKGVKSGKLNITGDMFSVQGSHMLMSYAAPEDQVVGSGDILFYLEFELDKATSPLKAVALDDMILNSEAYDADLTEMGIELEARSERKLAIGYQLFQNTPNPFVDYTEISFTLPENAAWTITVFDVNGKVLKKVEGQDAKGTHSVRLDGSELNSTGILYYQLDAEGYTATRKMVLIR